MAPFTDIRHKVLSSKKQSNIAASCGDGCTVWTCGVGDRPASEINACLIDDLLDPLSCSCPVPNKTRALLR